MKFSIHKANRRSKKLQSIVKQLNKNCPVLNDGWEAELEIKKSGADVDVIVKIYEIDDVGGELSNNGAPQPINEDGFDVPLNQPDQIVAGWIMGKLWTFWEEEG